MAGRWKPPKEDRIDVEAVRREREFQRKLRDVLEYGGEDDFVGVLKNYQPNMTKEKLRAAIMQFRVSVREKRGL